MPSGQEGPLSRSIISLAEIRDAAERIRPLVHRTPVLTSAFFDAMLGASVFFKCENLQRVGAFKLRGASNAIGLLSEEERHRGVVTHSSGNHGQAVALAARLAGIPAYVVMPRTAPGVKRAAVGGYGAEVIMCEPTLEARETTAAAVVARTGAAFVHPYNDPRIIAGQGTAALELVEDVGCLDVVLAPCGGGGLLSGTAVAVTELLPRARVIGAEPAGADDARRSLEAGVIVPSISPRTIADALLTSLGELTFAVISDRVERIITASDEAIVSTMRLVWERMKIVIEPSSAVPLAALRESGLDVAGKRVGIIISGGNVDLERLPWA
jgi:threonine dehydratase